MSSLKGRMFWMRLNAAHSVLYEWAFLQKYVPLFRRRLLWQQASVTVCVFCSRYFLVYSFSAFKYLPAPRVPFDCFALFTDRRSQPTTTYVFGHPNIGDSSIDPYSAPRNISETILSVFAPPPCSFLVLLLCFENMFTFATISIIYKLDGFFLWCQVLCWIHLRIHMGSLRSVSV